MTNEERYKEASWIIFAEYFCKGKTCSACQLSYVEGGQDECVKVWKKLEAKE